MKTYWGSGRKASHVNLGIRWSWVVSFTPRPLYLGVTAPGIHWIGDWVGPRACLNVVAKRKTPIISPAGKRTPVVQPVRPILTELPRLLSNQLWWWLCQIEKDMGGSGQGLYEGTAESCISRQMCYCSTDLHDTCICCCLLSHFFVLITVVKIT
jgi:hypothetical protein